MTGASFFSSCQRVLRGQLLLLGGLNVEGERLRDWQLEELKDALARAKLVAKDIGRDTEPVD